MNEYTIRKSEATEYTAALAVVETVLPSGRKVTIETYGGEVRYGSQLVPATVNWGGIGSVSLEDTRAYAAFLAEAIEVASGLHGSGEYERKLGEMAR